MANEYPRVLHRGTYAAHECLTVTDGAQETAAVAEGWSREQPCAPWFTAPEPVPIEVPTPERKKPGPKPKTH